MVESGVEGVVESAVKKLEEGRDGRGRRVGKRRESGVRPENPWSESVHCHFFGSASW